MKTGSLMLWEKRLQSDLQSSLEGPQEPAIPGNHAMGFLSADTTIPPINRRRSDTDTRTSLHAASKLIQDVLVCEDHGGVCISQLSTRSRVPVFLSHMQRTLRRLSATLRARMACQLGIGTNTKNTRKTRMAPCPGPRAWLRGSASSVT